MTIVLIHVFFACIFLFFYMKRKKMNIYLYLFSIYVNLENFYYQKKQLYSKSGTLIFEENKNQYLTFFIDGKEISTNMKRDLPSSDNLKIGLYYYTIKPFEKLFENNQNEEEIPDNM